MKSLKYMRNENAYRLNLSEMRLLMKSFTFQNISAIQSTAGMNSCTYQEINHKQFAGLSMQYQCHGPPDIDTLFESRLGPIT